MGYSPKGCKASDMTERLSSTAHSFGTDSSKDLTGPWLLQGLTLTGEEPPSEVTAATAS